MLSKFMGKFKKMTLALMLVTGIIVLSSGVQAQMSGEEIIKKVDETLTSSSRESQITMTIVNENGQKRVRTIKLLSKEEGKGLVEFLEPADVKGTSFLTVEEKGEENMWLFLPAVGNVRRIASHMRNGSFMGTDFTYNDMSLYKDKYKTELIKEDEFEDSSCFFLKSVPTEADIQYSFMEMWVRKSDFMPLQLKFYDKAENLLKVMDNNNIEKINGHLTPREIIMENIQEGTKTILELKEIEFNKDLPDNLFTTRNMRR